MGSGSAALQPAGATKTNHLARLFFQNIFANQGEKAPENVEDKTRMITVYGIHTCTTYRKAQAWLGEQGLDWRAHDHRKDGLAEADLDRWIDTLGWQALLNKAGTTWRQLPETEKADMSAMKARVLMLAYPALIKRPLFDWDGKLLLGFDDKTRTSLLALAKPDL
jgi:arsenate reductase (glutaredoxin)